MPSQQHSSRVVSKRELGRATLARQHLLGRSDLSAFEMIEHLVGMQAQAPWPPYAGLWSRMKDFDHEELAGLLVDRSVTRILLHRGTVHLVTAADCFLLRPLLQPVIDRMYVTPRQVAEAGGCDPSVVAEHARTVLGRSTMTPGELGSQLAARLQGGTGRALTDLARARLPLVQTPPRAVWGVGGATSYAQADRYLRKGAPRSWRMRRGDTPIRSMIRRYLGAFGPATVNDIQAWSGLTRLREVAYEMPGLVQLQSEDGQQLLDLPGLPRPAEDVPAPVRFLPEFDNLVLSHADRSRLVQDADRPRIHNGRGLVSATFLLDGEVAGTWTFDKTDKVARLSVQPFRRLPPRQATEVEAEAHDLAAFLAVPDPYPVQVIVRT